MNWQSIPLVEKALAIGVKKATGLALAGVALQLLFELINLVLILQYGVLASLFSFVSIVAFTSLCVFLANLYVRQ